MSQKCDYHKEARELVCRFFKALKEKRKHQYDSAMRANGVIQGLDMAIDELCSFSAALDDTFDKDPKNTVTTTGETCSESTSKVCTTGQ